ncbi:MAG TPA: amidohydrolase family protein [Gemmatimonadaceae bacterium]|nr:amidohydrolase family protein [Gemmatimonadaceae bacterium]
MPPCLPPPRAARGLLPVALGAFLLAPSETARAQNDTWALTNARIETVTKGTIAKGTIVIRNGMIEAVGANVAPPPDARVVDLAGRTVYPGIIDLTSSLGLPQPQGGPGGGGGSGGFAAALLAQAGSGRGEQQGAPQPVGLEPGRMVANEIRPQASDVRALRDAGITAVLVAPTRGAFRGQSALVPTREDSLTSWVVKSPVALHMGFQGVAGRYPGTLLGVIAYERQAFYDAQRHAQLMDRYQASGGRGTTRPSYDPDLDALVPAVKGQMPVFFAASNENEIRRAEKIAREFNLKLSVVGATEGFRAVDALKRAGGPAVVSVDFPRPSQAVGWSYRGTVRHDPNDSASADSAGRRLVEGNAAALHQAGVRFALASGGLRPADFLSNVRKAVAAGLPREVALEALTVRAAEAAGVGAQLGSIEAGKAADLVVVEGDTHLLDERAKIRTVFVDGIRYEVVEAPPQQQGDGRGGRAGGGRGRPGGGGNQAAAPSEPRPRPANAGPLTGTWDISMETARGAIRQTLELTQTGATLDGTLAAQTGTVSITDGRAGADGTVAWSVTLPMRGQTTTITFAGKVDGDRITGTATFGEGGAARNFTAERKP